jgi:hypothetical protein
MLIYKMIMEGPNSADVGQRQGPRDSGKIPTLCRGQCQHLHKGNLVAKKGVHVVISFMITLR